MTQHTLPPAAEPRRGHCTLVGAGPGDPELLTLKAVRAIQAATVLLVDDLVSDAIVALRSATSRVVYVGKRGGCRSTPQTFIEKLMVMAALEGDNVVRLKGGDPFLFGRGGEECEALRAAGVDVTVVNGISAGVAAGATLGVPLTHRAHAHGVLFLTGHARAGHDSPHDPQSAGDVPRTDWRAIAALAHGQRLTLVIYMGVSGAARIQAELLEGLPAATPVAIVQNVSLPAERQVLTTLNDLAPCIAREALASPSVIVVGDVLCGLLAATQQALAEHTRLNNQADPQAHLLSHALSHTEAPPEEHKVVRAA